MPKELKSYAQRKKERWNSFFKRPSAAKRGYGSSWQRFRAWKLANYPICQYPGCERMATDVHHLTPLSEGGENSDQNTVCLCHQHHSQITIKQSGLNGRDK